MEATRAGAWILLLLALAAPVVFWAGRRRRRRGLRLVSAGCGPRIFHEVQLEAELEAGPRSRCRSRNALVLASYLPAVAAASLLLLFDAESAERAPPRPLGAAARLLLGALGGDVRRRVRGALLVLESEDRVLDPPELRRVPAAWKTAAQLVVVQARAGELAVEIPSA